ncbi:MAG: trypsin-like peptidase domain-containing protein [Planctomycetota bacterium]|jgi:S1-C subfamily serine protease
MKRLLAMTLLVAGSVAAEPPDDLDRALQVVRRLEKERVGLARRLAASVCAVFKGRGGGSGVVISPDGLVLSNFHVTGLENEMRIGLNDHRIHQAVVLGVDPSGDLSLLRLKEAREWPYAPLGDSDALRQGDWVYAMGNPFLLATDFAPTITLGVVSGINRYQPGSVRGTLLYPDCIQTDASINPGNSGGPLFNFKGEVVGINGRVSLRDRGRVNIGVGYAISSNQIKLCLPELRAGKIMRHGTLNATVRSIDDPKWPGGVRVTFDKMLAPGCAHDAGIQVGDALVEFQGERITSVNQFSRLIAILPEGRRVSLKVKRYDDGGWTEMPFRLDLDGIELVTKSKKMQKKPPLAYLEYEVDRTFAAARALPPITQERRRGSFAVRGREPKPLEETYADGTFTLRLGDRVRTATPEGGRDGDQPLDPDYRRDMLERVAAWNDLSLPAVRRRFAEVKFTGGALVDGLTADRLEVKTKDGAERVYFIHLDTGRLLRVDLYSHTWVKWISVFYSDWRRAGGLLRPYRATIWDRAKETLLQTITYSAIQKG